MFDYVSMEITNGLVYEAASRMLEVWRRCKPKSFNDLAEKTLGQDIQNVRFEPAYHDGRSTGIAMTYTNKGYSVLTVVIPQFRQDKTIIRTANSDYGIKEFDITFEETPVEIAKIKNSLEESVVLQESLETSIPEMDFVAETA